MMKFFTPLFLALSLVATPAAAQTFPEYDDQPVVDQADLLTPAEEQALGERLQQVLDETGRPLVVATIADLEGYEIEDYGYRLGREWGIGDAETDDGTIFIIAPNDRRMRIETGYGARVFVPDILAGRVIRNTVTPLFKQDDYVGGINAGVDELAGYLAQSPEEAQARLEELSAQREIEGELSGVGANILMISMIIIFMMLSIVRRRVGKRYRGKGKKGRRRRKGMDSGDLAVLLWGIDAAARIATRGGGGFGGGFGGGGGGGFGGFSGGGGFGGGGASGGW